MALQVAYHYSIILVSILLYMCAQITSSMNCMHPHNYINSNLTAARLVLSLNILMGENCYVKISDFGMSRNLYISHYYIMEGQGSSTSEVDG